MMHESETASGEDALVAELVQMVPGARPDETGIGDDAAVVELGGTRFLFCIDTLVEGVHFTFPASLPSDVGWKAVAVNASDIAAMGGTPSHAVVSATVPAGNSTILPEAYVGVGECAKHFGIEIVGGDIVSGRDLALSVSMVGASENDPVLRSGARPGDAIFVTGALGLSELGLRSLTGCLGFRSLDRWRQAHRRPVPRVREGVMAAEAGATAMIDISDGLLRDLSRLCAASGTGAEIDTRLLPIADSPDPRVALEAALYGGDDYELCFTLSRSDAQSLRKAWPGDAAPLTEIGEIVSGGEVVTESGPADLGGWDHLERSRG